MVDSLKSDVNAWMRLKYNKDFRYALGYGQAVSQIIKHAHDVRNLGMNSNFLVKTELETWSLAAQFQLAAQDVYIGRQLGQALDKADHSREVGKGVAIAYRSLCHAVGWDITDQEQQYIEYRGHLHDAGRVLNLDPEIMRTAIPSDEKRRTPIEIALPAAQKLFEDHGRALGDNAEEIAEAICAAAISDRQGPLYAAAVKIAPDIKGVVRTYFHQKDVHNPVFLRGFHSYSAHHDAVFGTGTDGTEKRGQYSNFSKHGALDHLAIIVDNISAATGDAQSLDEIALWLLGETKVAQANLAEGKDAKFDPKYVRFILQDYGTGNSLLEQMHTAWVKGGYNRVPDGVVSLNKKRLLQVLGASNDEVKALNGKGENPFPQLVGGWSSLGSNEEARKALAKSLSKSAYLTSDVSLYVRNEVEQLPQLTKKRVVEDLKTVQSQSVIYNLSFERLKRQVSLSGAVGSLVSAVRRGGSAPQTLAAA